LGGVLGDDEELVDNPAKVVPSRVGSSIVAAWSSGRTLKGVLGATKAAAETDEDEDDDDCISDDMLLGDDFDFCMEPCLRDVVTLLLWVSRWAPLLSPLPCRCRDEDDSWRILPDSPHARMGG
jgi:hypothetical protein